MVFFPYSYLSQINYILVLKSIFVVFLTITFIKGGILFYTFFRNLYVTYWLGTLNILNSYRDLITYNYTEAVNTLGALSNTTREVLRIPYTLATNGYSSVQNILNSSLTDIYILIFRFRLGFHNKINTLCDFCFGPVGEEPIDTRYLHDPSTRRRFLRMVRQRYSGDSTNRAIPASEAPPTMDLVPVGPSRPTEANAQAILSYINAPNPLTYLRPTVNRHPVITELRERNLLTIFRPEGLGGRPSLNDSGYFSQIEIAEPNRIVEPPRFGWLFREISLSDISNTSTRQALSLDINSSHLFRGLAHSIRQTSRAIGQNDSVTTVVLARAESLGELSPYSIALHRVHDSFGLHVLYSNFERNPEIVTSLRGPAQMFTSMINYFVP